MARGLKIEPMPPEVIVTREGGRYGNWRYYFYRGVDEYRTGIDPIAISIITFRLIKRRKSLLPVFTFIGYLLALITQKERFDFAPIIFKTGLLSKISRIRKAIFLNKQ